MLILLADLLRSHSRKGDVVSRIGGDEFLLFLPGFTRQDLLEKRAEEICSSFREAGARYDKVALSISIGIAVSDGNSDFDHLFKEADDRLYAVKKSGKGSFRS